MGVTQLKSPVSKHSILGKSYVCNRHDAVLINKHTTDCSVQEIAVFMLVIFFTHDRRSQITSYHEIFRDDVTTV